MKRGSYLSSYLPLKKLYPCLSSSPSTTALLSSARQLATVGGLVCQTPILLAPHHANVVTRLLEKNNISIGNERSSSSSSSSSRLKKKTPQELLNNYRKRNSEFSVADDGDAADDEGASSVRTVATTPTSTAGRRGKRKLVTPPAASEASLLTFSAEMMEGDEEEGMGANAAASAGESHMNSSEGLGEAEEGEVDSEEMRSVEERSQAIGRNKQEARFIQEAAQAKAKGKGKGKAKGSKKSATVIEKEDAEEEEEVAAQASVGGDQSRPDTTVLLTNPFAAIHDHVSRSYRLEPLLASIEKGSGADARKKKAMGAKGGSGSAAAAAVANAGGKAKAEGLETAEAGGVTQHMLFGKQERKSGVFSFLKFDFNMDFYEKVWAHAPALKAQVSQFIGGAGSSEKPGTDAIPGLTLFNHDLGLYSPLVQSSAPLLLAQRLLLFPDHQRQFHALTGRENVPCDFFGDVDLGEVKSGGKDGITVKEGDEILLETLNYLEVRLPGIGFTDPFLFVLANSNANTGKVSFHIHARSMTFMRERLSLSLADASRDLRSNKMDSSSTSGGADDAEYDDLTDLVDIIEGRGDKKHRGKKGQKDAKPAHKAPRVIAFQDYRTVKLLAEEVNQSLGRAVFDLGCYRQHGMLRCGYSSKIASNNNNNSTSSNSGLLMPYTESRSGNTSLQRKLDHMTTVLRSFSDPEILELTFCHRFLEKDVKTIRRLHAQSKKYLENNPRVLKQMVQADRERSGEAAAAAAAAGRVNSYTAQRIEEALREEILKVTTKHSFRLLRPRHVLGPLAAENAQEYDVYGNLVSPYLTEKLKWKRYQQVVQRVKQLPPSTSENHDIWVRVGLALHNFSNEDYVFEEWLRFSLRCPSKYSRDFCKKKWLQFERNPDALNWRRGYNYLNTALWRQLGITPGSSSSKK